MTTSALAAAFATSRFARRDVRQRLGPRVGREADDRDLDVADLLVGDLTRPPGGREVLLRERRERLRLPGGAVVEGVVVGEVHHREAGLLQPRGVGRRRLERVTVRAAGAALRSAADRQRSLEVAEHDVPGEVRLDPVEERPPTVRRQVRRRAHHDVADGRDRDDAGGAVVLGFLVFFTTTVFFGAAAFGAACAPGGDGRRRPVDEQREARSRPPRRRRPLSGPALGAAPPAVG